MINIDFKDLFSKHPILFVLTLAVATFLIWKGFTSPYLIVPSSLMEKSSVSGDVEKLRDEIDSNLTKVTEGYDRLMMLRDEADTDNDEAAYNEYVRKIKSVEYHILLIVVARHSDLVRAEKELIEKKTPTKTLIMIKQEVSQCLSLINQNFIK